MKYRKGIYIVLIFCVTFVVIGSIILYQMAHFSTTRVAFLDVGQGDAILISQGSKQILIDGGRNGTVLLEQLGKQMPFWDRNIDIVIATHPDSDHIDGLIDVFRNYSVNQFWHTDAGKDTSIFRKLNQGVKTEKNIKDIIAYNGLRAFINNGIYLDVIYPFDIVSDKDDVNDNSIVTELHIGDNNFYFGGDLPLEKEEILPIGNINVLKASHHGSRSSTSNKFLQKTTPQDVVISVGKKNRYGHPHKDVIEKIENNNIRILRTDQKGTIVYTCTNKKCKVDFE